MRIDWANKSPFFLILAGFGLLQFVIAGIGLAMSASFVLRSSSAEGVVVAYQQSPKTAKSKTPVANPPLAPVIEYTPAGGTPVRFVGSFYERTPSMAVGDKVPVRYRHDTPEAAVIDVFTDKWALPLLFAVVGVIFLVAASFFNKRTT